MKKLLFATLAAGLITTACSAHNGAGVLPSAGAENTRAAAARTAAAAQTAPAGWTATATRGLTLANVTALGAVPSNKTIGVHVGLQMRDVAQAESAVAAGQMMDPATVTSRYAPTATQAAQVESYLRDRGFTKVTVEPNRLIVSGTGTAAQVEKAFATKVVAFNANGVTHYANTQPAYVPTALGGVVVAVLGLNDMQAVKTAPLATAAATPQPCTAAEDGVCARFYDPYSFQLAYGAPTASGIRTNVAIFTEGNLTQGIAYARLNEQKFNLPPATIEIVHVGTPSSDTSGTTEWALDMTYSSGLAGRVKALYLYNFPSLSDSDIVMGYNKWVTDDIAPIGNSSFGGCEVFPYEDGSMRVADHVLLMAALQGQTMFVSTGDNGGYCNNLVDTNGAPGGAPFAEWPAVSPYVMAVGGTDLFTKPNGAYLGETAWEAGGGGVSHFEPSPSWEHGVQPAGTTPAGNAYRGLPDVAMDGSLETGALLWGGQASNGSCTPCITGGTSLSSPLAAGAYARMQSLYGNRLGFAPVRFYRTYAAAASPARPSTGPPPTQKIGGLHDILSGSNGLFTALPRYDYTTGMGSIDIIDLMRLIDH